jgi:ubiquinone/menaquinone biosynthesis C-methylase UbiE
MKKLKYIVCPKCLKSLKIYKKIDKNNYILKCLCDFYPLTWGIIYMKNDKLKNKLINKILNKKNFLYLFSFSLFSNFLFRFKLFENILFSLNFLLFLKVIKILGYDKKYAFYLSQRKKLPSFFLFLLLLNIIDKKNSTIIDLGCGVGQLIPYYKYKNKLENVIGIDKDYFSLYTLRKYFVKKDTLLICYDLEKNIPLKSNSIDYFFMTDGFHNIKNKKKFIKQLVEISKNRTLRGAIIQMLSKRADTYKTYHTESQKNIEKFLLSNKQSSFYFTSSSYLWKNLENKKIKLINEYKKRIYNIVFTNKKYIYLEKPFLLLLKKTKINFYQDKDLLLDIKIKK